MIVQSLMKKKRSTTVLQIISASIYTLGSLSPFLMSSSSSLRTDRRIP